MPQCPIDKPKSQPILPIPIVRQKPSIVFAEQNNARQELQIYKRQYARLAQQNNLLLTHLNKATQEKQALQFKYNSINIGHGSHEDRQKRVRRTASQISRQYDCQVKNCRKSYGTEASLIQHIKLKHPAFFTSKQYENHIADLRKKTASFVPTSPRQLPRIPQDQQSTRIQDNIQKQE